MLLMDMRTAQRCNAGCLRLFATTPWTRTMRFDRETTKAAAPLKTFALSKAGALEVSDCGR